MNTSVLLAATSILALCAGGALAAGLPHRIHSRSVSRPYLPGRVRVLYDQNSSDEGHSIDSQNFSSSPAFNDQGADDFVVPAGHAWKVSEVDVTGVYFNGSGPAVSENVFFYKDSNGVPGALVKNGSFKNLNGGGGPDLAIPLTGNGLRLHPGRYWVSVVINIEWPSDWGWEVNSTQHGNQAMWQDPEDGFGTCPTWGTIQKCLGFGPDLMFDLKGRSKQR